VRSWTLFLFAAALAAQSPTPEVTVRDETPTFQTKVNLVRVPVVVRDKQGHAVGGLQKQDFQLTERGKPQYISQFSIEGSAVPKPAVQPQAPAPVEIPGEPAAESPKLVAPTRFVAYVFDDFHLKLDDLMTIRVAALKHIEHGIPPQERVALLTLSGRVGLEFTDDVAKFRDTLMKVSPVLKVKHFPPASAYMAQRYADNPDNAVDTIEAALAANPANVVKVIDSLPDTPATVQLFITLDCLQMWGNGQEVVQAAEIARTTLREVAEEGEAESSSALRVFNATVRLMSSMPGDRVMVLISPGMYLVSQLQRSLGESIDRATRAGIVVNTLDARGVYTSDQTGEVPGCSLVQPRTVVQIQRFDREDTLVQGLILRDLADSTGGNFAAQNDFEAEFDRLASPPEYVYYLAFYPKDLRPDGKFHELKVTLPTSKGLTITARKGYWAPSHDEDAAATATREITEAVFSRDEVHDLPIDLHTEFFKTSRDDAKATVISHLDIGQLPLTKRDGRNRDDLTVVCAVFDRNGNFVQGRQTVVELRLTDENMESRRAHGVAVNHEFDLKSGDYLVRVVARDAEGRQMAAVNEVVEIP
jgi:VWFA-related protein